MQAQWSRPCLYLYFPIFPYAGTVITSLWQGGPLPVRYTLISNDRYGTQSQFDSREDALNELDYSLQNDPQYDPQNGDRFGVENQFGDRKSDRFGDDSDQNNDFIDRNDGFIDRKKYRNNQQTSFNNEEEKSRQEEATDLMFMDAKAVQTATFVSRISFV